MNRSFMYRIMAALFAIVIIATAQAQAPQKFNYQAALRTNNNVPIINTPVAVRISIVKDSALGTVVYTETQTTTSNSNGVISLQIGTGKAVSGNFSTINWGAGNYYVKTETDPSGGTNYTTSGTAQLLSVPYALYAANSGTTGAAGKDGVGVSATKVLKDSLFVTLSNGQTLNAGNVRGAQGIQGIQGLTGATGAKGDSGARGLQGIQGIQGLKGDQGIQGIQGLTGATGAKGDSGARGLQGIQGIQGLKGDQGIQGIQGLTGATGAKGDSGARGLQGIQGIQGLKGDQGIQGIQGLTGATGTKGDSGARGLQGIQGIQGLKGDQGIQGIQGLTGLTGAKGDSGARGLQGIQGIQGLKGDQGIQGIQGLTGATGGAGVSITATKVTGDSLFISLSNGQKLNAGNVRGLTGSIGAKGDSGVSVRNTVVNGDSLYITLSTGKTLNAGNVRGLTGATGGYITHTIGEVYGGGQVFYVYDGGQHGLIVDTVSLINPGSIQPQYIGVTMIEQYKIFTSDGLLAGYINTILNNSKNTYFSNIQRANFGDWYIPSKYELNLLYLNKNLIPSINTKALYGSSTTNSYLGQYADAIYQDFSTGNQLSEYYFKNLLPIIGGPCHIRSF